MKRIIQSTSVSLLLVMAMFGCTKEIIEPETGTRQGVGQQFAGDEHSEPFDIPCGFADTSFFKSLDGSFYQNVCNNGSFVNPIVVPCVGPQPRWGSMLMTNGVLFELNQTTQLSEPVHYLRMDFVLAPGVMCTELKYLFSVPGAINLGGTGYPIMGPHWETVVPSPARSELTLLLPVAQLPNPCFELAYHLNTVQVSIFGDEIPGTAVELWGTNRNWNVTGHPEESPNEYILHYCPNLCYQIPTTTVCEYLPLGWPGQLPACKTLTATAGTSYLWSTGATTQSISVCPTTTTTYTVTVSDVGGPSLIMNHVVNVDDIRCGSGNGIGNRDILLCHVPPGNPSGAATQCVNWNQVGQHVAGYSPSNSPNMGHNSGCYIGRCGGNPCVE